MTFRQSIIVYQVETYLRLCNPPYQSLPFHVQPSPFRGIKSFWINDVPLVKDPSIRANAAVVRSIIMDGVPFSWPEPPIGTLKKYELLRAVLLGPGPLPGQGHNVPFMPDRNALPHASLPSRQGG